MKYFDGEISKGFNALLVSRLLLLVVGGIIGIFTPIFVYEVLGDSVANMLWYFAVASFVFFLFLPYGIKAVDGMSFKYALILSSLVGAIYHYLFYAHDTGEMSAAPFIVGSILFLTLYRLTYWVPFHTEFALFSTHRNRGRQVSLFSAIAMVISIFLPTASALLIGSFGFDFAFLLAVGLMLCSMIPYFYMPHIAEAYSWSVLETWREFACRAKSRVAIAFFAEGAENIIALYLWPVFLYQLFQGNLLDVGMVSTLIVAVSVVLQLAVGNAIDRLQRVDVALKWGSVLYAIGWIVKIFVATAFQVFVVGVYHTISKIFTETPVHTLFYDMSASNGDYVDEFTVLREMYVNLGRFVGGALAAVLSFFVPVTWLFVIGAVAALTFHFVSDRDFALRRCL